jgi:hypothetical protein
LTGKQQRNSSSGLTNLSPLIILFADKKNSFRYKDSYEQ